MRNNTDPVLVAGLHQHSCQCENRFRFTPVKILKPAPRIWDRKLTTPLTSRGPRKLWKRILSARNDMKQPRRMTPAGQDLAVDESDTEINGARDMNYFRGVKRRCIQLDDSVVEDSGHLFTETKWEFETSKRKRKTPANTTASIDRQQPKSTAKSSAKLKVYEDKDTTTTTATPAAVRELTQEQESRLVRSALRSSLDDDDTALLNNFLSKAKAKRAAKEAEAAQEEEEKATQETLQSGYETPPRKVLDKLDENSPSPTKQQFPPVNIDNTEDVPAPEAPTTSPDPTAPTEPANSNETNNQLQQLQDQQQPARPAARRNTRRRRSPPPLKPPSRIAPPAIRKSASRATKEIEFILGDADDRDMFLRTRQNTFVNMGVVMRPSDKLAAMEREERRRRRHERSAKKLSKNQSLKEPASEAPVKSEEQDKSTKTVTWKKKKFIEFSDGDYLNCYREDSLTDATTETDNEFPNMIPFARTQPPKDSREKDSSENVRPPKVRRVQRGKKPLH